VSTEPASALSDKIVLQKNLSGQGEKQQNRPQGQKPGAEAGFTVQGKPAEAVLVRWCAKH
jgi:hypothetical protein